MREVHRELDEGLNEWQRAFAPATPPTGSRVVALYVHAATVEDITINSLLRRVAPVYETDWDGKGPCGLLDPDLVPFTSTSWTPLSFRLSSTTRYAEEIRNSGAACSYGRRAHV